MSTNKTVASLHAAKSFAYLIEAVSAHVRNGRLISRLQKEDTELRSALRNGEFVKVRNGKVVKPILQGLKDIMVFEDTDAFGKTRTFNNKEVRNFMLLLAEARQYTQDEDTHVTTDVLDTVREWVAYCERVTGMAQAIERASVARVYEMQTALSIVSEPDQEDEETDETETE